MTETIDVYTILAGIDLLLILIFFISLSIFRNDDSNKGNIFRLAIGTIVIFVLLILEFIQGNFKLFYATVILACIFLIINSLLIVINSDI